jgi:hypothetical protein
MAISFSDLSTEGAAEVAISRELPPGTTREKVERTMLESGAACYPQPRDGLICVLDEPPQSMVRVSWRLNFAFQAGRLTKFSVTRGLTGA